MLFPVRPQQVQCAYRQRQVAIFGSFAVVDVNRHSLRVDVSDLQVEAFFESQSQRVDRPHENRVVLLTSCFDELLYLFDGQDIGQLLLLGNLESFKDVPVARTRNAVEEFQRTVSDFQGAGCKLAFVDQVQQIVGDLLLSQLVRRQFEVAGQLSNFAKVAIVRPFGSAQQLQVAAHLLPQRYFRCIVSLVVFLVIANLSS